MTDAIRLLREKQSALDAAGENRLPRRSDFSEQEVNQIKAALGPWPRALEAAGLKPPREDRSEEEKQRRRIASKKRKTAAKTTNKQGKGESS